MSYHWATVWINNFIVNHSWVYQWVFSHSSICHVWTTTKKTNEIKNTLSQPTNDDIWSFLFEIRMCGKWNISQWRKIKIEIGIICLKKNAASEFIWITGAAKIRREWERQRERIEKKERNSCYYSFSIYVLDTVLVHFTKNQFAKSIFKKRKNAGKTWNKNIPRLVLFFI